MDKRVINDMHDYIQRYQKRKRLKKVFSVLASIVVFCTTYALILPAITMEGNVYCGHEEHSHVDECYQTQLICQITEPEEVHIHTEECYIQEKNLICSQEETAGHIHDENCKRKNEYLICELEETEVRELTDNKDGENDTTEESLDVEHVEGQAEASGHVHSEECYQSEEIIICGLEEIQPHVHTDECFEFQSVLNCDLEEISETEPEEKHEHNGNCYQTELICNLEEHEHEQLCYSNPKADVETKADWEKTLPKELSGIAADDVIAVAESQLGYKESTENYILDSNGDKKGYTRYGEWYGDKYGHWCAMFVSFCLEYGQIKDFPQDSNCQNWITTLEETGRYKSVSSYVPQKGDLIFFQWDSDQEADHVGLVAEVEKNASGALKTIKTIEGNSQDKVRYVTYEAGSDSIMGYGQLQETMENSDQQLTYKNEEMTVEVTFSENYKIPDQAELEVNKITLDENEETYNEMADTVKEAVTDENHYVSSLELYELNVVSDGETQTVPEDVKTQVEITYEEPLYTEQEIQMASEVSVLAIGENSAEDTEAEFENIKSGITAVTFTTDGLPDIALTSTEETITGNFWKRIDDLSEIKEGDTIIIVSAEGYMAVTYNADKNRDFLSAEQVVGNPSYYEIEKSNGAAIENASKFKVDSKSQSSLQLLNMEGATYLSPGRNRLFTTNSSSNKVDVVKINRDGTGNSTSVQKVVWHFDRDNYYMACAGANLNNNGITSTDSVNIDSRKDMLMFRLENKTLSIPGNFGSNIGLAEIPKEPGYTDSRYQINPSGSLQSTTTIQGLNVGYASDAATSNLEDKFGTEEDDGKLLTDKSVVYGKDDYGAFSTYDEGTFGVTLSALGQVPSTEGEMLPNVDVIIILDTSYSMLNASYAVNGEVRMIWAMRALNNAINQIMRNPNNRIGVVSFSDGAQTMLPLDHYQSSSGVYFDLVKDERSYNHNRNNTLYDIDINSNVRNSNNVKPAEFVLDYGDDRPNWEGTFTQTGIQEAGKEFLKATTVDENNYPRQPVFILISDGGPTLCSTNFRSPQSGPVYGNSGNYKGALSSADSEYTTNVEAEQNNVFGINGYYTVLTAQYYKDMVGHHYGVTPRFASIGIGISESDKQNSVLHDNTYCRAVLHPSDSYIQKSLTTGQHIDICGKQLKNLLENKYNGSYIQVPNHYKRFNTYDVTYSSVPVLKNPYTKYDYADQYYDATSSTLEKDLLDYIHKLQFQSYDWSYVLKNQSKVEMEDPIGYGMEVKGDPILRFAGRNYNHTSKTEENGVLTYIYNYKVKHDIAYPENIDANSRLEGNSGTSGITYDLSKIKVTVSKKGTGMDALETVRLEIPEELLPIFYLEAYGTFYYKELPIRLIYQVGLSGAALDEARKMKAGEERVYYTNQWQEGVTADAMFTPKETNAFDFNLAAEEKKNSTTNTLDTSFKSADAGTVTQELGNNGKLVLTKDGSTEPIEFMLYKVSDTGNSLEGAEFTLYYVRNGEDAIDIPGTEDVGVVYEASITVPIAGRMITIPGEDGVYYLIENKAPKDHTLLKEPIKLTVTDGVIYPETNPMVQYEGGKLYITNNTEYVLPKTGGTGTHLYVISGILLMTAAAFIYRRSFKEGLKEKT